MTEHYGLATSLHPDCLRMFQGVKVAESADGVWDIEFPTVGHAVAWVDAGGLAGVATLRTGATRFDATVVVQVRTARVGLMAGLGECAECGTPLLLDSERRVYLYDCEHGPADDDAAPPRDHVAQVVMLTEEMHNDAQRRRTERRQAAEAGAPLSATTDPVADREARKARAKSVLEGEDD